MINLKAIITYNQRVASNTYLLKLSAPAIASKAIPGQFVMIDIDLPLRRPFSISNKYNNGEIAILYKIIGKGTGIIAQKKRGEVLDIIGPLGNGFKLPDDSSILIISGGIGIAPLIFLAEYAKKRNIKITWLIGARSKEELIPDKFLPHVEETIFCTEDGSKGKRGMVTDFLNYYIDRYEHIFACGPLPMYRTMFSKLQEMHMAQKVQVSLEVRMGCGLGICYSCSIKTSQGMKQVCRDGPVFKLNEVDWEWVKI